MVGMHTGADRAAQQAFGCRAVRNRLSSTRYCVCGSEPQRRLRFRVRWPKPALGSPGQVACWRFAEPPSC